MGTLPQPSRYRLYQAAGRIGAYYKDNIDTAIRLARENRDFRWTIESTWMLEQWLKRTSDQALIEQLGELMRSGRISLGAAFADMHSGLMAPEESTGLIYLAQQFRSRFRIEASVAFKMTYPGSLGRIRVSWPAAG